MPSQGGDVNDLVLHLARPRYGPDREDSLDRIADWDFLAYEHNSWTPSSFLEEPQEMGWHRAYVVRNQYPARLGGQSQYHWVRKSVQARIVRLQKTDGRFAMANAADDRTVEVCIGQELKTHDSRDFMEARARSTLSHRSGFHSFRGVPLASASAHFCFCFWRYSSTFSRLSR